MTTQLAIRKNSRFKGHPVIIVRMGHKAKGRGHRNVVIQQIQGAAISDEWTIREQQLIKVPLFTWLFFVAWNGWKMPKGGR